MERSRVVQLVPVAILIAVGAGYLWEIASLTGVPIARDVQMFFVPQKRLLWEALQAREIPLWTPFIGTGAPFLANIQSGFFYPPHWLYAVLPFYVAFDLLIVFHVVLGGLFAFALCRRLGRGLAGSYVGAATWMLGGYFASLLNLLNALQAGAWAPGVAWAALGTMQSVATSVDTSKVGGLGSPRGSIAVLAGVVACAALAGEPQSVLLAMVCAAITVVTWSIREHPSRGTLLRSMGAYGVAALVVLGLVMAQVLPTLEFLSDSGRGSGLSLERAAAFDIKPVRLLYMFVPTDFRDPEYEFGLRSIIGSGDPWLFSIYLGALFPLLAALALRSDRKREARVWLAAAALAILVGLGDSTPVFPWLFEHVPGLSAFRFPEKYFMIAAFAAMLIAAFGAEEATSARRHRGDRWWALAYVAVPLAVLGFINLRYDAVRDWALAFGNTRMAEDYAYAFGLWSQNLAKLAGFAALAVGLVWIYRKGRIQRHWFAILLGALVSGDLAIAGRHLNPVVDVEFYET
ncbi:MAG: hypothetical protein MJB57_01855 [Gemmatimonadetes bacterium]|nr:hypothetical protein [Gemmatimonadota bacterium]